MRWFDEANGLRFVSLRYFNAAGASEKYGEVHDPETHLIPLVLQAAMGKRRAVQIYGGDYPTPDGTAIRDYIHVIDLADAHLLALEWLANGGETPARAEIREDALADLARVKKVAHTATDAP